MTLDELLKGNILIGSRVIGMAKVTSDWDIVCTFDTFDTVMESKELKSYSYYEHGYEVCTKLNSNEDDEYEDSDQGGFGADLQGILVAEFHSGLKINLFVYPNKKKWKLYKKLNREIKEIVKEVKEDDCHVMNRDWRQEWVDWFVDLQYELGIHKDLR